MFIDIKSNGGGGGEPHYEFCKSCNGLIEPHHSTENLHFETSPHDLEGLNGIYHAQCAAPFLSIKRALDMMNRMLG